MPLELLVKAPLHFPIDSFGFLMVFLWFDYGFLSKTEQNQARQLKNPENLSSKTNKKHAQTKKT